MATTQTQVDYRFRPTDMAAAYNRDCRPTVVLAIELLKSIHGIGGIKRYTNSTFDADELLSQLAFEVVIARPIPARKLESLARLFAFLHNETLSHAARIDAIASYLPPDIAKQYEATGDERAVNEYMTSLAKHAG